MADYKVIFHVDEMTKWNLVLANAKNLLNALHDDTLTVEILANSEAVKYLVQSNNSIENGLLELVDKKVVFSACNNSLKSFEIDPKNLFAFVEVVPSGVAQLTLKQYEGFAYIKP